MTTPFGGAIKYIFPLNTAATETKSITNSSSGIAQAGIYFDWSKLVGTPVISFQWGHPAVSTATGGTKCSWYDFTNATVFYTSSSNVTSATNTDISTFLNGFTTFTKPASTALLGFVVQSNDTTARSIVLSHAYLSFL